MLGVATVTAREALVALRAQGLISTVRGRNGGSLRHPRPAPRPRGSGRAARGDVDRRACTTAAPCTSCCCPGAPRSPPSVPTGGTSTCWRRCCPRPRTPTPGTGGTPTPSLYLSLAALSQSARMTRQVVALEADFGALLRQPLGVPEFQEFTRGCHEEPVRRAACPRRGGGSRRRTPTGWGCARRARAAPGVPAMRRLP
ncbi:hypothetical protein G5V59_16960 [Nocardioides sp. W3-2-3]|uniref:hypothetical protein n=1 Tax=Nocardioides convexus TaxID=2712224 RepID=UPI002418B3F2|nr:hypothetical protein [Nocardioides convexus]NHA01001.1 hypothetical protein [Nocardioides convexus]